MINIKCVCWVVKNYNNLLYLKAKYSVCVSFSFIDRGWDKALWSRVLRMYLIPLYEFSYWEK